MDKALAPKTARGRRIMKNKSSKIVEDDKKAIFLKSTTASQLVKDILLDLHSLKAPRSRMLQQKNPMHAFDDASGIEFLAKANDSSLFGVGSHSKKRPHSLTFGRTFDWQILDMIEFQVNPMTYKSVQDLSAGRQTTARFGAARMMLFVGDVFDESDEMRTFKNMMLDFFRSSELKQVNLAGLESIIVMTGVTNPSDTAQRVIYFRHYNILKKKSGTRLPKVVLEEVGPHFDMVYNRVTKGSDEITKNAYKQHYAAKVHIRKNVELGQLGQKLGRVHMEKQDFNQMALAKLKGLGKRDNPNAKRKLDDEDAASILSDDFAKADPQTKKKMKKLPAAYVGSIISE